MNWQPDKNDDWDGFRGWIVWPSLAALLSYCLVNFVWACAERAVLSTCQGTVTSRCTLEDSALPRHSDAGSPNSTSSASSAEDRLVVTERAIETRNPVYSGMSSKQIGLCLALATLLCIAFARLSLAESVTWIQLLLAVLLALPLSVVAIQAMGQAGMNPVSALGTSVSSNKCHPVSRMLTALSRQGSSNSIWIHCCPHKLERHHRQSDCWSNRRVRRMPGRGPDVRP